MVKLTVLYGHPTSPADFETYYTQTHMPIANQMKGIRRGELSKFVAMLDGSPPPYYRMAEFWFDSIEQMTSVVSSPEGRATAADLPNFATGDVTLLVSEVV